MKHREKIHCPNCHSEDVRYADSMVKHFQRWLAHSRKRYCPKCKTKWVADSQDAVRLDLKRVMVLFILLFLIYVIILLFHSDPLGWFKTEIRSQYDQKYGSESKEKLREDFGSLYKSDGAQVSDYEKHRKS